MVKLVNGETDEDVAVRSPYNLFVGGNKLGRGVTIKNLLVSYYGRHPRKPQADTVLQHARMYGYRRKDIGLLRLFLPPALHTVFKAIHKMEQSLRELIAQKPSEEFRGVYVENAVSPTRKNVLVPGAIGVYTGGGNYNPSQVLRDNTVRANTEKLDKELEKVANKGVIELQIGEIRKLIALTMPDPSQSEYVWNPLAVAESIAQFAKLHQHATGFVYVDRDRGLEERRRETQGILAGGEFTNIPDDRIGLFLLRTKASSGKSAAALPPAKVFAIQYEEVGKSEEILKSLKRWGAEIELVPYRAAIEKGLPLSNEPALIDVTGLAKPVIFHAVRHGLRTANKVLVAHTQAKSYYPTDRAMKALLRAEEQHNRQAFFETLSKIVTGEVGPYDCIPLLQADADETRRNVLFAFASPKHERLLSLIDNGVIDRLEVVAPAGTSARNRVAKHIAEIAASDITSADVTYINSDDLEGAIAFLMNGFNQWYVRQGFNFEIGLTGSKMEAVAAAAISTACKVTQCWYVRPAKFDPLRFTKGAGQTRYFRLELNLPSAQ
jgi:hypothetical protein